MSSRVLGNAGRRCLRSPTVRRNEQDRSISPSGACAHTPTTRLGTYLLRAVGRHCRHHARNVLSAAREAASKAVGACNRAGWGTGVGSIRARDTDERGGDKRFSESESGKIMRVFRFPSTWGLCRHVRSPRPASVALAPRGSIKRPEGHKTTQRHAAPTSGSLTQPCTLSERALGLALSPSAHSTVRT